MEVRSRRNARLLAYRRITRYHDLSERLPLLRRSTDLMKTMSKIDLMLLGLLARQPMHGYEIAERLGGPTMDAWVRLGRTSVYYALGRLDRLGLVSRHAERHGGKPERTVYSITDDGRKAFYATLGKALSEQPESMDRFDVALYYANQLEPDLAASGIQERADALRQALATVERVLEEVRRKEEDAPAAFVLEHKRVLLEAEIAFLAQLAQMLAGEEPLAIGRHITGRLEETVLHEVLRNLAAAHRSGVLKVHVGYLEVGFWMEEGRLIAVVPAVGSSVDESLSEVFSAVSGRFEFTSTAGPIAGAVEVEGLIPVILRGCRSLTSRAALNQMAIEQGALLDTRPGYEYETLGVDLAEDERRLLAEIDGIRTLADLAGQLGWNTDRVVATVYPLWAVGWAVKSDSSKRQLLVAFLNCLRRFAESIELLAGKEGVRRVFDEVSFAADGAHLPDFWRANARPGSIRFSGDRRTIADAAKEYFRLVVKSAAARLGEGFVADALGGVARRLPENDALLLRQFGIGDEYISGGQEVETL